MAIPQDPDLIWIQQAVVEYGKSRTWFQSHVSIVAIDRRDYVKRSEVERELQPRTKSSKPNSD